MEEIQIKIMPSGEVKIEVHGVKGARCEELTRLIEQELGIVTERVKTQEYYQTDKVSLPQYNTGGQKPSKP